MDILPSGNIFRELQVVHDTGYLSAQTSLEDHWEQVIIFGLLFIPIPSFLFFDPKPVVEMTSGSLQREWIELLTLTSAPLSATHLYHQTPHPPKKKEKSRKTPCGGSCWWLCFQRDQKDRTFRNCDYHLIVTPMEFDPFSPQ